MIRKKPVPDPIGDGYRFSEKIMLHQNARAPNRFNLNGWRSRSAGSIAETV
jgi:hypothetical protein